MPDKGVALVQGDIFRAHPIEIIVSRIVLPHMVNAEGKIFALAQAPHRRAMSAGRGAPGKVAARLVRTDGLFGFTLDPDAIEDTRI
ncbi:hypothetical protein MPC1_9230004 [Methylocella tundrae]|nr:hypothetical protein MPC1_9230004 [Methylocella tundrae]